MEVEKWYVKISNGSCEVNEIEEPSTFKKILVCIANLFLSPLGFGIFFEKKTVTDDMYEKALENGTNLNVKID